VKNLTTAIAQGCAAIAAALGALALIGWGSGYLPLSSFGPERIPMAPGTALLLALLGTAVFFCARKPVSPIAHRVGMAVATGSALIGLLLFVLFNAGVHSHLDHLGLAIDGMGPEPGFGHMSPVVALCFVLAGASLAATLIAPLKPPAWAMAGFWLAGAAVLVGIIFLLAYLFGMPLVYRGALILPALPSSSALTALGLALVALAAPRAWAHDRQIDTATLRASLKLVLVFALMAVGLVGAGSIHFRSYAAEQRAQVESRLSAIAQLKAEELVIWRRDHLRDASLLRGNATFAELVRRAYASERDAQAWTQLRAWLEQIQQAYAYEGTYLLDLRGRARISVPGKFAAANESESVQRVLRTGEVTLEDLHRDEPGGAPHLTLLVPVADETQAGRILGVAMLQIDPEKYLYPLIDRRTASGRTAETLLVRREGNEVVFLNELRFYKNSAVSLRYPLARTDLPAVKAALGYQGIVEGTDYRGAPVIAAVRAVPGTPWHLVARIDPAEFMEPIENSLWLTAILVGALLLASGVSVGLLWRHQRARHYAERSRAAELVAAGAERYRAIAQSAPDAIITANSAGAIAGWNAAAERIFGYGEAEALGRPLTFIIPEPERARHAAGFARVLSGGERHVIGATVELYGLKRSGAEFPLELSLSAWQTPEGQYFTGIVRDISERKRAEQALARQKDLYNMLSQTNQTIVRMTRREELFPAVCRTAVEYGHFRFAWIGMLGQEKRELTPVAHCGEEAAYVQQVRVSVDASDPAGRGPAGEAFRTGKRCISNDFLNDPAGAPWHVAAQQAGVKALAAYPLRVRGRAVGVMLLAASEPGFYTEDLLPSLDEMALDVSFALDNFERQAETLRIAEALRESEARFRNLVERTPVGIAIVDREKVLYGNPRAAEIMGYAQADFQGLSFKDWIKDSDWPRVEGEVEQLISGEISTARAEFTVRRRDGAEVMIGAQRIRIVHEGQPAVLSVMQDISEKKRTEEQIQRYMCELEAAFMGTVSVVMRLSELRDPYTAGHERRVAGIATAIGGALGLDAHRLEGLKVAGYLHDVGKMIVPAEILSKPGKLTALEYELIKLHAQAGYDALKEVPVAWPVAQVALQHHERMDGSGYPLGLKRDEILLEARIIAVADVVEAMSSHRPYRSALGLGQALAEIERGRGTAYDPEVADACLRLFRDQHYAIPV